MRIIKKIILLFEKLICKIIKSISPTRWKEHKELSYWRKIKAKVGGVYPNSHYKYFYVEHFGLDETFYDNKVILDIGCGPRGSLEWAATASRRIGLDPLANKYLKLGADQHEMEYINSSSENIPMEDSECDAVFSFNSLDHVEDVGRSIREIKRVTKPGGIFLLLVEVNHPPTDCEPHELNPEKILRYLEPEFICQSLAVYKPDPRGIYKSVREGENIPEPEKTGDNGYMSAKFVRQSIT